MRGGAVMKEGRTGASAAASGGLTISRGGLGSR
jgi:hypothetical protein